tara:strand:+ start:17338 stop:17814 length:477 start_codon:yes stop_codon:yes gene_type:complete
MLENSALITFEDVRKYACQNNESLDMTVYTPEFIYGVQIECIEPVFEEVYNEIEAKLIAGDELESIEVQFIDRIKHPLALFCKVKMLPQNHLQDTNSGVALMEGEYFKQAITKGVGILSDSVESTAISLMNKIVRWYAAQSDFEDKPADDEFTHDIII